MNSESNHVNYANLSVLLPQISLNLGTSKTMFLALPGSNFGTLVSISHHLVDKQFHIFYLAITKWILLV